MRISNILGAEEIARIADLQRNQQASWRSAPAEGYDVMVDGLAFLALPDVFSPRSDTRLLSRALMVPDGGMVLDVGTGTGVLAVMACRSGAASCIALDISPAAVRNAETNAVRHGLSDRIDVRLSDGLEALRAAETFDVVIANLPGRAADAKDLVEAAQWDSGLRTHRNFFSGIGAHLAPGGRIVMTKANYPEINDVLRMAEDHGLKAAVLAERPPEADDPRTYRVLEFSRAGEEGA